MYALYNMDVCSGVVGISDGIVCHILVRPNDLVLHSKRLLKHYS